MTQINHDVVRSAIRELIDSKTISGAALARETGTSTATVSQFLNGWFTCPDCDSAWPRGHCHSRRRSKSHSAD